MKGEVLYQLRKNVTSVESGLTVTTEEHVAAQRAAHVEIERLRVLAKWIERHWENQDMNHEDFRVAAYTFARAALPTPEADTCAETSDSAERAQNGEPPSD